MAMKLMFLILFILLVVISIGLGLFLCIKPNLAIDIQKRFYRLINWNIEPLSKEKEIRNTRIMGMFLITATILIISATIIQPKLITSLFGVR